MLSTSIDRALLLARTVRHLHPAQVAHRVRLRGQKAVLGAVPGLLAPRLHRPVPAEPGWPEEYQPLDGRLAEGCPSAEANAEGRFRFLDHERSLGEALIDWEQAEADQLWRYHLHYFEWAWAFTGHPDRAWARAAFTRLWRSWASSTTFGRWDAWSPYVVSLRAWAHRFAGRLYLALGLDAERVEGDCFRDGPLALALDLDQLSLDDATAASGLLRAAVTRYLAQTTDDVSTHRLLTAMTCTGESDGPAQARQCQSTWAARS